MNSIKVSMIAAVAENGVIGRDGDLPWKIKSEMKYFKATTMGHPVIHGRKSFESLGGPLPGRLNVVITRDPGYKAPAGVVVAQEVSVAINIAQKAAREAGLDEIFVAGGAGIYGLCLPHSDRLYLTEIHAKPAGDVFFPPFDRSKWVETKREFHKALEGETADYTITILERKFPKYSDT